MEATGNPASCERGEEVLGEWFQTEVVGVNGIGSSSSEEFEACHEDDTDEEDSENESEDRPRLYLFLDIGVDVLMEEQPEVSKISSISVFIPSHSD